MSVARRTVLKAMGAGTMMLAMSGVNADAEDPGTVFELRVYHTIEGRLPALLARFRDHTISLFTKHGLVSVAYWTPSDEPLKDKTLIYVLKHASRDEATKNWKAFGDDPAWVKAKVESEASGAIVERIESTFMALTDFSPRLG